MERTGRWQPTRSSTGTNYLGNYAFGSGGAAMTADTQDGFANAYLGNFNNYQEGQRAIGEYVVLAGRVVRAG